MNPIEVRDIGQTVERTPIRGGNIDIVMACIRKRGTECAEQRLGNAISRISRLADITCKTGFVERSAGNQAFADQRNSRKRGDPKSRTEKSDDSQSYTKKSFHVYLSF